MGKTCFGLEKNVLPVLIEHVRLPLLASTPDI